MADNIILAKITADSKNFDLAIDKAEKKGLAFIEKRIEEEKRLTKAKAVSTAKREALALRYRNRQLDLLASVATANKKEAQKTAGFWKKSFSKIASGSKKAFAGLEKNATNAFGKISKKASTTSNKIKKSFSNLKNSIDAGKIIKAGAGVFAIKKITSSVLELAKNASIAENAIIGMSAVISKSGASVKDAKKLLDNLTADGLLNREDIAESIKNLVSMGFTLEQTNDLIKRNADIATVSRQGHLGLSESIKIFSQGLKNNNAELTDSTGITKNVSKILKEAGFSFDDLSDSVKGASAKLALINGITEESSAFQGLLAKEADKVSGSMAKMDTQLKKVKVQIGSTLGKAIKPLIDGFNSLVETAFGFFSQLPKGVQTIAILTPIIIALGVAFAGIIPIVKLATIAMYDLAAAQAVALGWAALVVALGVVAVGTYSSIASETERVAQANKETEKNLKKLGEEYERLAKKQNRTEEESQRLFTITNKISNALERDLDFWHANTEAIDLNVEAIRRKIEELEKLKFANEQLSDIAGDTKNLDEAQRQLEVFRNKLSLARENSSGSEFDLLDIASLEQDVQKAERAVYKFEKALQKTKKTSDKINNNFKKPPKRIKKAKDEFEGLGDELKDFLKDIEELERKLKNQPDLWQTIQKDMDDLNAGLTGFRDTLEGINDDSLPKMLGGFGQIVSVIHPALGGIIQSVGTAVGLFQEISGLLEDEVPQLESIEEILERMDKLQAQKLKDLRTEFQLQQTLFELELARAGESQNEFERQRAINSQFLEGKELLIADRKSLRGQIRNEIDDFTASQLQQITGQTNIPKAITALGTQEGQERLTEQLAIQADSLHVLRAISSDTTGFNEAQDLSRVEAVKFQSQLSRLTSQLPNHIKNSLSGITGRTGDLVRALTKEKETKEALARAKKGQVFIGTQSSSSLLGTSAFTGQTFFSSKEKKDTIKRLEALLNARKIQADVSAHNLDKAVLSIGGIVDAQQTFVDTLIDLTDVSKEFTKQVSLIKTFDESEKSGQTDEQKKQDSDDFKALIDQIIAKRDIAKFGEGDQVEGVKNKEQFQLFTQKQALSQLTAVIGQRFGLDSLDSATDIRSKIQSEIDQSEPNKELISSLELLLDSFTRIETANEAIIQLGKDAQAKLDAEYAEFLARIEAEKKERVAGLNLLKSDSDLTKAQIERFSGKDTIGAELLAENRRLLEEMIVKSKLSLDTTNLEDAYKTLTSRIQDETDPFLDTLNSALLAQVTATLDSEKKLEEIANNTAETTLELKTPRGQSIVDLGSGLVSGLRKAFTMPSLQTTNLTLPSSITESANVLQTAKRSDSESIKIQLLQDLLNTNKDQTESLKVLADSVTGGHGDPMSIITNLIINVLADIGER